MGNKKIRLGFTNQEFEAGIHICQIYNDDDERNNALIDYVICGQKDDEKTACFSENIESSKLSEAFAANELSYEKAVSDGQFSLSGTTEVYFAGDKFDPDRMLDLIAAYHETSEKEGYSAARIIGEMIPEIQNIKGGSRLLEYESRVSLLLKKHPVTAVCQYDARLFDGATIMDVLKVHPYMIVKGAVVSNPFFIKPEDFLANIK